MKSAILKTFKEWPQVSEGPMPPFPPVKQVCAVEH